MWKYLCNCHLGVIVAAMKHHEQKKLGEESVYWNYVCCVSHRQLRKVKAGNQT